MNTSGSYCRICGTKLQPKDTGTEGIVPYCPACGEYRYPQYNVAVSMIVIDPATNRIMLIQQYGRSHYILVAGYVSKGESLEDALRRELKEETGMSAQRIRFNRTQYFEPSGTLMCNFTVFVKDADELKVNYEIDSYKWFTVDEARKNIKQGSLAAYFLNSYLDEQNELTDQK